jgi:hypothetical protein
MVNKNVPRGPLEVVLDQVLFAGPLALPLWILGVAYFFRAVDGVRFRFLGWTYVILLLVMVVSGSSRPDRITAMYTLLFAAGGVVVEALARRRMFRFAPMVVGLMLVAGGVVFAPVVAPVLPPPELRAYLSALGFSANLERGKMDEPIPQWIADRLGWEELVREVAVVYRALPLEERRSVALLSTNYGHAGALELYGPAHGLPPVYATHNSFHSWGPPSDSIRTFIVVHVDPRELERRFASVVEAAVHTCAECTRPQRRIPIYVARGPLFSMAREWPGFRIYN